MAEKHDDAFPWNGGNRGMSLRDYFASHAIGVALIAARDEYEQTVVPSHEVTARIAYELADAMLKARGVQS